MDILNAIVIELPCNVCGEQYPLTLKHVLLSQDMLHEGCLARSESECPPIAYARLLDRELIEDLQQTWLRLEEQARAIGAKLSLR